MLLYLILSSSNFCFNVSFTLHFKEIQKLRRSAVKKPTMKDVGLQFDSLIPIGV